MGGLVVGVRLDGLDERAAGGRIVFGAVVQDANAGEGAPVGWGAGQGLLEECTGLDIPVGIEVDLAKLEVGLGLEGAEGDGALELGGGGVGVKLELEEAAKAVVGGGVPRASGEVGAEVLLGGGEVLLIGLDACEGINSGQVGRVERKGGGKGCSGGSEEVHGLLLDAEIGKERGVVREGVVCVLQGSEGGGLVAGVAGLEGEGYSGVALAGAGGGVAEIDGEDGLEAVHCFWVMMFEEKEVAEEEVRRGGVGTLGEGAGEEVLGLARVAAGDGVARLGDELVRGHVVLPGLLCNGRGERVKQRPGCYSSYRKARVQTREDLK